MDYISRRQACLLLACAPLLAAGALHSQTHNAQADETTAVALASAQEQYEAVQAQIDSLAYECELTSIELADTLDCMEAKQAEINQAKTDIIATQAELETAQTELAAYLSDSYKSGPVSILDVLFNSASYDDLFSNIYYSARINNTAVELIDHTKNVKQELQTLQSQLEGQYSELETFRALQASQLAEIQQAQNQAYGLLVSLDAEVQALTAQYNQELYEQALASQQSGGSSGGSDGGWGGGGGGFASLNSVINACYYTPSPGYGLCAAWVTNVMANAGLGWFGGNACDMYANWCYSSDRGSLQPGMIIAVSSHSATTAGRIYGHIGIYIGGGVVMDNIGYIRSIDVDSWISFYGDIVTPRWGWLGGITLA